MSDSKKPLGRRVARKCCIAGLIMMVATSTGCGQLNKRNANPDCPSDNASLMDTLNQSIDQIAATNQKTETPVEVRWKGKDGRIWVGTIKPEDVDC